MHVYSSRLNAITYLSFSEGLPALLQTAFFAVLPNEIFIILVNYMVGLHLSMKSVLIHITLEHAKLYFIRIYRENHYNISELHGWLHLSMECTYPC